MIAKGFIEKTTCSLDIKEFGRIVGRIMVETSRATEVTFKAVKFDFIEFDGRFAYWMGTSAHIFPQYDDRLAHLHSQKEQWVIIAW